MEQQWQCVFRHPSVQSALTLFFYKFNFLSNFEASYLNTAVPLSEI